MSVSPVRVVQEAVARLELLPVRVGMAPEVDPEVGHRHGYVNVPVWLWVDEPDAQTWGPIEVSAQAGSVSVSMVAEVAEVVWDMGDGTQLRCGQGTVFHPSAGFVDSPTCGHRYEWTSKREPGGMYTVTATSQWRVLWSASNGQSGSIPVTTSTSVPLEIRELRAVNVQNPDGVTPQPTEPPEG